MDNTKFFTTASIVSSNRVLYTPSYFARNSLLHLQEIGELKALAPHTSKRDGLQSYLFFTILSGSGILTYNGKEYNLTPSTCVFIDCHHAYSHTTDSHNLWTLRWCHFYGPTLSFVYEKYCERGGKPVFSPDDPTPFVSVLDSLYRVASGADYIRDMRINEELNRLCTLLMEHSWHPEDASAHSKKASVVEVRNYLDSHFTERITLDQLAGEFYIDKYYLSRMFKEQYGVTITGYLQSVRITQAKQMLRFTDKSVEEIGLACGLDDLHYFSRVFKKVEGITPSTYRSQW